MTTATIEELIKLQATAFGDVKNSRHLTYILAGKEIYQFLLEKFNRVELAGGFDTLKFTHNHIEFIKFGLGEDWDLLLLDQNRELIEKVRIQLTKTKKASNQPLTK